MITPELISYIRAEFGRGRKREEIRTELMKGGGWTDADLSEAFRIIIPMQGFGATAGPASAVSPSFSSPSLYKTPAPAPALAPTPVLASVPAPAVSALRDRVAPFASSASLAPSATHVFSPVSISADEPSGGSSARKILLIVGILVVIGGLGFGGWFYRVSLMNFWNSGVSKIESFVASYFSPKPAVTPDNAVTTPSAPSSPFVQTPPASVSVKDCGVGTSPDLKKPLTYENNAVLSCLGDSALNCTPAKAVLQDPLFPSIVEISNDQNASQSQSTCNFKLSYAADSTLVDNAGVNLAGQYISCPVSLVKAINESKIPPVFSAPDTTDLGKYAAQVYFYGILGVFVENGLDQNKLQNLGCSGPYINSVIDSYNKTQSKT